jgi:hypothetical protein
MAGTFFQYFDGYLRVVFHPVEYGTVPFDLILHGGVTSETPRDDQFVKGEPVIRAQQDVTVRLWISSALGGFGCLISWLEAVTCGVQECAFGWDGEGPDGELRWHDGWKSGTLKVTWTRGDRDHSARLNKAQMVRAFYESFRGYVASAVYDPLAYETLTVGETFVLVLEGTGLDTLAGHLATLSGEVAERFVDEMLDLALDTARGYPRRARIAEFTQRAMTHEVTMSAERRWIPVEWDQWSGSERRAYVMARVYAGGTQIGFGERLRELRSSLVEKWLAEQAQLGSQDGGRVA